MAVTAGRTVMLSTLTGKLAEERKALAVDVSLSCCERTAVPAVATSGLENSMAKLKRTLAAATLKATALRGTPISEATLERSDTRTSAVKSGITPATTTSAVTTIGGVVVVVAPGAPGGYGGLEAGGGGCGG